MIAITAIVLGSRIGLDQKLSKERERREYYHCQNLSFQKYVHYILVLAEYSIIQKLIIMFVNFILRFVSDD